MERELLERPVAGETARGTPPAPLHLLDRALDRELARACALVDEAASARAQVILATVVGAQPILPFWEACNARAAQLCDQYGVEILLVEENGLIRIRIDGNRAGRDRPVPPPRWRGWWNRCRARRPHGK